MRRILGDYNGKRVTLRIEELDERIVLVYRRRDEYNIDNIIISEGIPVVRIKTSDIAYLISLAMKDDKRTSDDIAAKIYNEYSWMVDVQATLHNIDGLNLYWERYCIIADEEYPGVELGWKTRELKYWMLRMLVEQCETYAYARQILTP